MKRYITEYPPDWFEISKRIRFGRAGGRCEQCGAQHCAPLKSGKGKVILTCHHIGIPNEDGSPGDPRDKSDCRDANLIALCQRCHLAADRQLHKAKRNVTLQRRRQLSADKQIALQLPLAF